MPDVRGAFCGVAVLAVIGVTAWTAGLDFWGLGDIEHKLVKTSVELPSHPGSISPVMPGAGPGASGASSAIGSGQQAGWAGGSQSGRDSGGGGPGAAGGSQQGAGSSGGGQAGTGSSASSSSPGAPSSTPDLPTRNLRPLTRSLSVEPTSAAIAMGPSVPNIGLVASSASSPNDEEAKCRERLRKRGIVQHSGPCTDIDAVIANLDTGKYHFNKPEHGWVAESFTIRLVLPTAPGQNVDRHFQGVPGTTVEREARVAQNLEAKLEGGKDFKVEPPGPVARVMTSTSPVVWTWTVTPLMHGKKKLIVAVDAVLVIGQDKLPVPLNVLEEPIEIRVGIYQQVKAAVIEANVYLVAIAGFLTALGGIIAYLTPVGSRIAAIFRRKEQPTGFDA